MEGDECGQVCRLQQAQTERLKRIQEATTVPDINASAPGLVPVDTAPPSAVTDPHDVPLLLSSSPGYTDPRLFTFPTPLPSPSSSSSFLQYPISTTDANFSLLTPTTTTTTTTSASSSSSSVEPFAVRPSPTGGMGAFATRALLPNEVILEETPLFTSTRGDSIFKAFGRASRKKQKEAMKLHASSHFKPGTPYLQAVWDTNSFATSSSEAGLFPLAARFNHACEPANNVHYAYDAGRRQMRFWVAPEGGGVAEGQELTICYGRGKTPDLLYRWYGFRCGCGACEGVSEQEMDSFEVRW
ncbi:SET domain-containing protein 5 [Beauveria bassiana]|uniref:SET domain-containing protein 5 n=1 Tax=Beauveria bassiana TaxID=176275 RepID=A0A2N6NTS5_BEABA|nr:SET domain-containing protein 5 [Beauveria bassiana]